MRIAALALVLLTSCASHHNVQQQIRAQYDALERAFAARDIAAILMIRDSGRSMRSIWPTGSGGSTE